MDLTTQIPRKEGQPTKYRKEFNEMAFKLCLLGAKDKDLARFFEVTEQTVNHWKNDYPKFFSSLKAGKEEADAKIGESLYHRAKGYSHPDVHISNFKGEITITPIIKHYPPDTTAAIFWLKNRNPQNWRDVTRVELTGKDGEAIEFNSAEDLKIELVRRGALDSGGKLKGIVDVKSKVVE